MPARPVSARWAGTRAPTGALGSEVLHDLGDALVGELGEGADGRHPVAGAHGHVAAGAHDGRRLVGRDDQRRELAVQLAQGGGAVDDEVGDEELAACERQLVGASAEADLDDGGGGQRGDVQHAAFAHHLGQRVPDLGVGHADDQPHLRAEPAHEQGGLQCGEVVGGEADDGRGVRQPGLGQRLAQPAAHQRHVPLLEQPFGDGARLGDGVDHHHLGARGEQLLDRAQRGVVHTAHHDVAGLLHDAHLREVRARARQLVRRCDRHSVKPAAAASSAVRNHTSARVRS